MYRIKIFTVSKTKEKWLQEALSEYEKRLKSIMPIEWILAKNNDQLETLLDKEPSYVALSPLGKMRTSEEFSTYLFSLLESQGSRLNLVIGGAEGLPDNLINKAKEQISLSPMTFTHQIARLILIEQIYRATEIQKGSQYHK